MTNADKKVLNVYAAIKSLETPEQRTDAIMGWWDYLNATCTRENPCVECVREMEAHNCDKPLLGRQL